MCLCLWHLGKFRPTHKSVNLDTCASIVRSLIIVSGLLRVFSLFSLLAAAAAVIVMFLM